MVPEISIIIPVYNCEKYIVECLDSIRAQTVKDFEVILVNDGSPDNSEQIVADYISKNLLSNFHLISKENGGVSSARNVGLSNAQGKWIFFFDSDDWIEPDCFETLLEVANKTSADLIIGGYQMCDQTTGRSEVWSHFPCDGGLIPEDIQNLYSFSFIWGRLYKNSIIKENELHFDERIRYTEDTVWQLDYIKHIKSFAYSHKVIYNYRYNTGDQLTSRVITPNLRRYRWEHLQKFLERYKEVNLEYLLKNNRKFLNLSWEILVDTIVLDILDKKSSEAKEKIKSSKTVIDIYTPRSKKEKVFLSLMKHSFTSLHLFVLVYYKNYERIKKSSFYKKITKRKKV